MGKRLVCLVAVVLVLVPALGGQAAEMAHRWSFNGDLRDSVGGQDAVIVDLGGNNATLSSTAVTLAGGGKDNSDYIDLPDRILSSLGDAATIEIWATQLSVQTWSRIFDFGTSTTHNVFMSWTQGTNLSADRVEWLGPSGNNTVNTTVAPYTLGTEFHIVCVFEPGVVTWYVAPAGAADLGVARGTFNTANRLSGLDDTNCWLGRSQWPDATANAQFNECRLWKGALTAEEREGLHDLGPDGLKTQKAGSPVPANGATDVLRESVLGWTPGDYAASHDVYLGTSLDDVSTADRSKPLNVLVRQAHGTNTYDPEGRFELGQTYYWRVDEVNAAPDFTVLPGEVWHFTVEPYSYAIPNITATASSVSGKGTGPEKTVDRSGLDPNDRHSTLSGDMWLSKNKAPEPAWIQFAFEKAYKLDKMPVWNSNQAMEGTVGVGAKDVTVEYSSDGENWTALGDFEFVQASGEAPCAADTVVDFAGVAAQYVKLTINSNWGGFVKQYSLSEVRFLYVPVSAREPSPAAEANEVNPQVTLSWRPGREAASHQVYLSEDRQAVVEGTAAKATVTTPEYEASVNVARTYYWKVVEVNEAETLSTWESDIWSFATSASVAVDDFESYTDDIDAGGAIFQTWIDGWDNPTTNGAVVGYSDQPFAERGIVHGGNQSMPLAYDNGSGAVYSEAKRTFEPPQDWTKHGVTTLVVYFYGQSSNSPAPLYVKINDTKVLFNNGAAATTFPLWKQWNINLAATGANLKSVKSLTIGIGDGRAGGAGTVFIDDLRLYETAPEVLTPVAPANTGLVAYYTMEGNVQDSSGKNNHGTTSGDALYDKGVVGQALLLNGTNTYVDLPIGSALGSWRDITIATFVKVTDTSDWQRVFDFGTGTTVYMFLTPYNMVTDAPRFAITTAGAGANESAVTAPSELAPGWHHLAAVIDSASMTMQLYVDGELADSGPTTKLPSDLGATTQNWLGRSQWADDPYFTGALDEFRIYTRALSAAEVRYLAGDR